MPLGLVMQNQRGPSILKLLDAAWQGSIWEFEWTRMREFGILPARIPTNSPDGQAQLTDEGGISAFHPMTKVDQSGHTIGPCIQFLNILIPPLSFFRCPWIMAPTFVKFCWGGGEGAL